MCDAPIRAGVPVVRPRDPTEAASAGAPTDWIVRASPVDRKRGFGARISLRRRSGKAAGQSRDCRLRTFRESRRRLRATGILRVFLAGARIPHMFRGESGLHAKTERKGHRCRHPVCRGGDGCPLERSAGSGLRGLALGFRSARAGQPGVASRQVGRPNRRVHRRRARAGDQSDRVGTPTHRSHTERLRRPDRVPGDLRERKVVA